MDLLRFDTKNYGAIYIRADYICSLGRVDDQTTTVGVMVPNGAAIDLIIESDVHEVAQSIERAYRDCRIHHIV